MKQLKTIGTLFLYLWISSLMLVVWAVLFISYMPFWYIGKQIKKNNKLCTQNKINLQS